jgi:required for meiotic nuclear division protein 1
MKKAQAYHVGNKIDLQKARQFFSVDPIKSDSSFLLYQLEDSFVYIKDFGAIVFFDPNLQMQLKLIKELDDDDNFTTLNEDYLIRENSETISLDFTTISVPTLTLDHIHLIALNLAQSVALDHYQSLSSELLASSRELSGLLEQTGKIGLNRIQLAKFIGKTVNLKNRIAENLYIFDSPDIAWNEPDLSELDLKMNRALETRNRHQSIQHEISTVTESLQLFREMLQHQHSAMLEWIIIILILIEVVHIFI